MISIVHENEWFGKHTIMGGGCCSQEEEEHLDVFHMRDAETWPHAGRGRA